MVDYDYLRQEAMFEGNIPEDIVMEILKRLPAKCLSRFRYVCKDWRDLIRSRFFFDVHSNYRRSGDEDVEEDEDYIMVASRRFQDNDDCDDNDVVLSFYTRRPLRPLKSPVHFPLVSRHDKLYICTCNSIVCLADELNESSEGAIYLCKPATRECRKIPPRPFRLDSGKFPMSKVNRVVRVSCGFGFDPRTNEYMVVSVMKYWHEPYEYHVGNSNKIDHVIYQIEIYDLSSNSWREVEMVLPPDIPNLAAVKVAGESYVFSSPYWNPATAVLLNGCLHWIYGNNIIGFDLSNETFRNVGKVSDKWMCGGDLMAVDDSLAVVCESSGRVSVLVMEDYGDEKSWVKRYCFRKSISSLRVLTAVPGHGFLFHKSYGYGRRDNPDGLSEALVSCNLSGFDYHLSCLPHGYRHGNTLKVEAVVVSGRANLVPLS